jgi:hypothetical protein
MDEARTRTSQEEVIEILAVTGPKQRDKFYRLLKGYMGGSKASGDMTYL